MGNLGEEKTGVGRCVWRFGVTSVLSNNSIFLRETVYEGKSIIAQNISYIELIWILKKITITMNIIIITML